MQLIIAEKPELGRDIAHALLPRSSETKGVISDGNLSVIWCYGHMLQLKDPAEYDSKYQNKKDESILPIYFKNWEHVISKDKVERTKQIGALIKQADVVIHAGDPDDEGQLLIDELLAYFNYHGQVKRLIVNDNLAENIIKAYKQLEDNQKFINDGKAAYARQMTDACFGFSHSRLASIRLGTFLTVGRVQSAVLGMVVNRDEAIKNHVKQKYYTLDIIFNINGTDAKFTYKKNDKENPHVSDKTDLENIVNALKGKEILLQFKESDSYTAPPLPYNLTKLQADMNTKYGYSLDETLDITQTLRDSYKAITYNRSDSQYLKEEHYQEAPQTLATAMFNLNMNLPLDYSIHSKCFNDKNVTAHHGIIPQNKHVDVSRMKEKEKNVYKAIVERYAMQFLPPVKSHQSTSKIQGRSSDFNYKESFIVDEGYKKYFKDSNEKKDEIISIIKEGTYKEKISDYKIDEKETKPLKYYTPASLVQDMSAAAKYVKDEKRKAALKKKDEGKKGENGSIGTSATRAAIVNTLISRKYLAMNGKKIVSTELGQKFYHALPHDIASPDVTADWYLLQEEIREGKRDVNDLMKYVVFQFKKLQETAYKNSSSNLGDLANKKVILGVCPVCYQNILLGNTREGKSVYYHENYKEKNCTFKLFENMQRFKDSGDQIHITPKRAMTLLAGGRIPAKINSKNKGLLDAYVKLKKPSPYCNFEIDGFIHKKTK